MRYFSQNYEVWNSSDDKWGTKKALNASLVGWLVLSFATLGFAPLELDSHDEFEVKMTGMRKNSCIRYM